MGLKISSEVRVINKSGREEKQFISIQVKVQYMRLGRDVNWTVFSWAEINGFKLRHSKSSEIQNNYSNNQAQYVNILSLDGLVR